MLFVGLSFFSVSAAWAAKVPSLIFQPSSYAVSGTGRADSAVLTLVVRDASDARLADAVIDWSIISPGENNGVALDAPNAASDDDGIATVTVSGKNWRRTVTVRATLRSTGASADAIVRFGDPLPSGFLALYDPGSSPPYLYFSNALAFCAGQGGHLPRIKGAVSRASSEENPHDPIEGFGRFGERWPSGLPSHIYWTGTVIANEPGLSWIVFNDYVVSAGGGRQNSGKRVVCVP
ncbi:hypothetical protein FACS1894206_08510 [Deltaproteobacteria bacterium]|nr:hypothetical protein FACS1894206_08510 [Deltaproteobacteria bacterium]